MTTVFLTITWMVVLFHWYRPDQKVKSDIKKVNLPFRFFRIFNVRNVTVLMLVLQVLPLGAYWIFQKDDASVFTTVVSMILCALGVFLAIWSKKLLGVNWSGTPSIKDDHDLITKGPYGIVRHPIYLGLLLVYLGSALVGIRLWIFVFLLFLFKFLLKIRIEEKLMMEKFPEAYANYKKHTKILIPFVI